MNDQIIHIGTSLIQHGPCNDRIYLMNLMPEETEQVIPAIDALAEEHGYSKLFAKVPDAAKDRFSEAGYSVEAHIPQMYRGREDGWFLARYPDPDRANAGEDAAAIRDVLKVARDTTADRTACTIPDGYHITEAAPDDAPALAALYQEVFASYPFPIHDPAYLRETMADNVRYFLIMAGDHVVAASSAEVDPIGQNAEMTDFATHPDVRGRGLCPVLLQHMEEEMRRTGICTAYTIARAAFYPITVTFARAGYRFGGTLINNTQICGHFESMNVWYRSLTE